MSDLGTYTRDGDHVDVQFIRHYPRPPQTVWQALTDPARLADWMGVSQVEPWVGGRFDTMLDGPKPMRGEVLRWDPPNTLELRWSNDHAPDSTIRYELSPDTGGTRVIFTHRHMPYATSALMLPGWHVYFDRLDVLVSNAGAPEAFGTEWRRLQAIYIDHYGLSGSQRDP